MSVDLDPRAVADVQRRLDAVEREHGVCILHAIESGSRAWGFPSPDSDYDCRFVYAHPVADYARLHPPRDVIETPLTPVLDVNGWDLRKALRLGLKGNAAVLEWLRSPIVYRAVPGFAGAMDALLADLVAPPLVARHYLGLAYRFVPAAPTVRLKKLLYALRPLMALEWMRARDFGSLPPMAFGAVLDGIEVDAALRAEIDRLLAAKAATHEIGEGPVPPAIAAALDGLDALERAVPRAAARITPAALVRADAFLLDVLAGSERAR